MILPLASAMQAPKMTNLPVTIKYKTNETGKNQSAQPAKRRTFRVSRRRSGVRATTAKQFMEELKRNLSIQNRLLFI
jgi:hypothetical protein